jgi:hypothetical protein
VFSVSRPLFGRGFGGDLLRFEINAEL